MADYNKNGINIPIGVDTRNLQSGIDQAASIIKDSGQKMADAVASTGEKSANGLKSLQQAYRATYKDAQILAQMQGTNSAAFQEAAAKAAEYKDTLEDVQDAIKAASPEQRWKVVGQAIQGASQIAQGFVGTMNLIGVETQDAEKAIAQMMALQGISNAISGVFQLKDAFVALNAATQASVVGIGLMAAAWVVYNLSVDDAIEANQRYADSAKASLDAENKIQDIVYQTNQLRIKAMKDGSEKQIAIAEANYKREMSLLYQKYEDHEIAEITYNNRRKYLYQIYQNELTKIQEDAEKKRNIAQKIYTKPISQLSTKSLSDPNAAFNEAMMPLTSVDLSKKWAEVNAANLKGMGEWKNNFKGFIDDVKTMTLDISSLIGNVLISSFDLLGETIANVFTGNISDTSLIKSIGEILANFMRALGSAMIAAGVASESFKVLFATGVPAIIAGGALIAGASLVSGLLKSAPSSNSSGGGSGSYSMSYGGGYMGANYQPEPIQVGGLVRGSDLQIVLINTNNQTRRVR